jgi:hypothetical protein
LQIQRSIYSSPLKLFFLGLILVAANFIFSILDKLTTKYVKALVVALMLLFLYGFHITTLIVNFQTIYLKNELMDSGFIMVISFMVFFLFQLYVLGNAERLYFQNAFLAIFVIVISYKQVAGNSATAVEFDDHFRSRPIQKNDGDLSGLSKASKSKPIIYIVLDGYHSANELHSYFKDTSVYAFTNKLKAKGWKVFTKMHSYELSTIHSLSSIFNFNLSNDSLFPYTSIPYLGSEKLKKNSLNDGLKKKGIPVVNYGIFDLGENRPLSRLYFYPENFIEQVLFYSSYHFVYSNNNRHGLGIFASNFEKMENHNHFVFTHFKDTLGKINKTPFFLYMHLLMPHEPFSFGAKFPFRKYSTKDYYKYWQFTNDIIEPYLDLLSKNNRYRIIVSGDHGLRQEKLLNPNNTFAIFYGFSNEELRTINSVQDIGKLIYLTF